MATKNMAYDNPAYMAVLALPTGQINGANGVSTKYAAFTAMTIKSVTLGVALASTATAASNVLILKQSGTATTTTTYGTIGSGALFVNVTPTTATNQVSCVQGDVFWVQNGADTAGTFAGMIEAVINPLASVTAP